MTLNREFTIIFTPKDPEQYQGRSRFAIGAGQLHKYVGLDNVNTALQTALNSRLDKCHRSFRKHGRIDFYRK